MSNFHSLEVVGRDSETQLQVGEIMNYLIERFKCYDKASVLFGTITSKFAGP